MEGGLPANLISGMNTIGAPRTNDFSLAFLWSYIKTKNKEKNINIERNRVTYKFMNLIWHLLTQIVMNLGNFIF